MLAATYFGGEQFHESLKVLALCAALVTVVVATAMAAPLIVAACSCVLVCAAKGAVIVGLFAAIAVGPRIVGKLDGQMC